MKIIDFKQFFMLSKKGKIKAENWLKLIVYAHAPT